MSRPVDPAQNQAVDGHAFRVPRLYVGLGGSAGSLKALETFFEWLDADAADSGAICFVVITHRGPDQDGLLSRLLANHTGMTVQQIDGPIRAEAGHVYVSPADQDIVIRNGWLSCEPNKDEQGQRSTIDRFMASLAGDQRTSAVAIALSGTGHDASAGLRAVQQAGGLTIAQTPEEAAYPELPGHAIDGGFVSQVLAVQQMPAALARLLATLPAGPRALPATAEPGPPHRKDHQSSQSADAGADGYDGADARALRDAILSVIKSRHGRDFFHYKRGTIARRIARRMEITHAADLASYLETIRTRPDESENLLGDLRIGVTGFFRDEDAFACLEKDIVPQLVEAAVPGDTPLRIWVPGCASGEEAYSLAMVFSEALQAASSNRELQIFATDIDEPALARARQGIYSERAVMALAPARRKRWFDALENGFRITRALRSRVIFAVQSVIADPPFSRLDLISCRNVLIYLEKPMQRQVIGLFHFALRAGGLLFLGNSENIDSNSPLFAAECPGVQIYRARQTTGAKHFRLDWMQTGIEPISQQPRAAGAGPAVSGAHQLTEQVPRLLVDAFAPASVVTNERFELLYLHGDLGDYLSFPSGAPTDDLLRMARRGIETRLRRVVTAALAENRVASEHARLHVEGERYRDIEIRAQRFFPDTSAVACVLLSFRPTSLDSAAPTMPIGARGSETEDDDYSRQLQQEIKTTREENRRLNDELQATRQEFRTTHEEALSVNEELQSSNEELESSKEELQSLNEELSTVNAELNEKMIALREASSDIENLLDSTGIATIFLDADHQVKRFTPAARGLFNLIDTDVGRPLSDISHVFAANFDIEAEAEEVQQSRCALEHEIATHDDRWFLRRMTPYRVAAGQIDGAALSFLEVTPLKQAERQAAASHARFRAIYEDNPAMYFILDRAGDIASVNKSGARQLGYEPAELTGRAFASLHEQPDDLRSRLESCLLHPGRILRWELGLRSKAGQALRVRANARRVATLGDGLDVAERDGDGDGVGDGVGVGVGAGILISCENITPESLQDQRGA